MMRGAIRRACVAAAGTLVIVGCGGTGGTAVQAGTVTDQLHPSVLVADVPAGAGSVIDATQHVTTDPSGQVRYTIGAALDCLQDIGTDVTAEPGQNVLLRYNSGSTVTCGTLASKGNHTRYLSVANLTITIAEPVFTIVRQQTVTIIRVFQGRVSVKSSDGGPAVTVLAGRQLTVRDGQAPGPPMAFSTGQISKFELRAEEQLVATPTPAPSTQSSGIGVTR